MNFFNRFPKNTARPDEDNFSLFLIVVAVAAVLLTCFLIYALVAPTLFGDDEPEYEIAPYGGGTQTAQPTQPVILPTTEIIGQAGPTPTPAPTQAPSERIEPETAQRVNLLRSLAGHSNAISSVAYSLDGRFMASGDWNGLVKLWDARSLAEIYTFQSGSNRVDSVAFSPDGSRLAAAGQDSVIRMWDLTNAGAEMAPLTGPTAAINSIAFSPTGAVLAAGSDDGFVYVWNMPGGALLGTLQGHTSYVTSVDLNPAGALLAAGGEDDTVRLWTIPDGVSYGVLRGHTSTVTDVAFSPDGSALASTSADRTVRLWDMLSLSQTQVLTAHTENVNSVTYAPDGRMIATAAGGISDNTVRLWNAQSGAPVGILQPAGPANSVAFSPGGLYLAVGGATFLSIWGVTDTVQPTGPVVQQPAQTPAGVIDGQGGQAEITTTGEPCHLVVRLNDVNVRSGPGINYTRVGSLTLNQQVQALGWARGIDGDGFTWWRTGEGWIRGDVFIDAANPSLPDACWVLPEITTLPPTPAGTAPAATQAPAAIGTAAGPCVLTVRADQVNVRAGVGESLPATGQLLNGQTVQAVGWATGPELFTWWQLDTGGWVRGDAFVDAVNTSVPDACLTLPYVE